MTKQAFKMDDVVPLILPAKYRKDDTGIFKIEDIKKAGSVIGQNIVPLSWTPFDIVEQLKNPDTGEHFLKLRFNGEEKIFSAGDLASRKGIVMLASFGVNTTETKAAQLSNYIMEVRALNNIPVSEIYSQMGWKADGSFVLGDRKFTLTGVVPCRLSVQGKEVQAIKSCGDIDGWVKAVDGLLKHAPQRIKMYNAVKAPILHVLREQNNILNDSGGTSQGKTITSMCAMSTFGDPDGLMLAGGATVVAVEQLAGQMCDLPIHIDDTQKINKDDLDKIIYSLGNGIGKGRGAKTGGMQDTLRFRTVALCTGEDRIIKDNSFDGMDMRILEVTRGLGEDDVEAVHDFKNGVKNHYGVFGEVLIRYLVDNKDAVIEMHKASVDTIKKTVTGADVMDQKIIAVKDRLIGIFAPTLTAGKIFESLYPGTKMSPEEIVKTAFKTALEDRRGESYTLRGARAIHGWIAANQAYFLNDGAYGVDGQGHARQYKALGNIKPTKYVIIPSELKLALKDKFSVERLMDDFKKEGFLITGKKDKHTLSSKIKEQVIKAYVLDKSSLIHLLTWKKRRSHDRSNEGSLQGQISTGNGAALEDESVW
jgi:putative DNA primase/helicase